MPPVFQPQRRLRQPYEDEFQLEEVKLSAYLIPSDTTFGSEWDRLRTSLKATETFDLSAMEILKGESNYFADASYTHRGYTAVCDSIMEVVDMEPLGGTQTPASTSIHTLQLSGLVAGGGGEVLVRCRMAFLKGQGVTWELSVRAEKQVACYPVLAAVGG